jgi:DNA-directed RNA polymerase specialized sigma subunit
MKTAEQNPMKGVRRSEYERTREKHIKENMWKASHTARKISSFSGLPYDELRSVALEAMVKLYDKWDPTKANFSTWLNRSLNFQVLNYLRDHSRMIKMPRSYADAYMKIRKIIGARPEISDEEVAKQTNLSINLVRETRNAYQVTYQEINEDTEMPVDGIDLNEDNLDRLLFDYKGVLEKIADLPENDYQFLMDVYVDKRANSTIFRKYAGITTTEKIKEKTQAILSGILEDPCP